MDDNLTESAAPTPHIDSGLSDRASLQITSAAPIPHKDADRADRDLIPVTSGGETTSAAPTPHRDVGLFELIPPFSTTGSPATPGALSPVTPASALEVHASGESEWEEGEAPRQRAWRPQTTTYTIPRLGTKRVAADPSPATPPAGKKKKKKRDKTDKRADKKAKANKPLKKKKKNQAAAMSDAEIFSMLRLVADRRGWTIGDTPAAEPREARHPESGALPATGQRSSSNRLPAAERAPQREFPVPPARPAPMTAPPAQLAGQQRLGRAPAALGAPPGEETYPTRAPHVPVASGFQPEESSTTEASVSDWSSVQGPPPSDSDAWSVTSGAPSLIEPEASPGLKHLGEEAEALLLRYLNEFYSVQPDTPDQQPQASMLFRAGAEPDLGIPLTADFKREYTRIAQAPPPRGAPYALKHAFLFQPGDTEKYLAPEKLSPEVLAVGEHVARGNPLRRKQYVDEDKRWTHMSALSRSSMRLAAYAGALTNLAVQADELQVTREDRLLLNSLLLSISELMWKQSTRASLYTTRRRRDLALSALGFSERQGAQLTRDMPYEGPFLFSGQFTARLKEELSVRQQARELAGQLRQSQSQRPRSFGQPRAYPRSQAAPQRVTVTLPPPQPNRGSRGGGGRSHGGRHRGQRGHRQAARGRRGF